MVLGSKVCWAPVFSGLGWVAGRPGLGVGDPPAGARRGRRVKVMRSLPEVEKHLKSSTGMGDDAYRRRRTEMGDSRVKVSGGLKAREISRPAGKVRA
ncbi:hypothetical protein V6N11_030004 [Hibiscus sabdariffa]|uniref:Uncharacterized protein n=1 Tax=Hibiscus sabdariffa TaxID=183260 RepID=A0ABR2PJZ2_9ROSI